MSIPKDVAKIRRNFYIFAYQLIEVMKIEDFSNAEWGCLLDNPNVTSKIDMVNHNGRIEYHLPNDTQRRSAHFSEIRVLRESEVLTEIKLTYKIEV